MKYCKKIFAAFGIAALLVGAPSLPVSMNVPVASAAAAQGARIMQVIPVAGGEVTVTEYGDVKLHAFRTADPLTDESYALESNDGVVLIEGAILKSDIQAWKDYVDCLGKPVVGVFLADHPNGYDILGYPIYTTDKALRNWQPGGAIYGISGGLVNAFGDTAASALPAPSEVAHVVKEGETVMLAGVELRVLPTDDDAFELEIPALNAVYRHMMGSHVHSILSSRDFIAQEIEEMNAYQKAGYTLILTSHYIPEGREAVASKLAYLEKALEFSESCGDGESFKAAMKAAFPDYEGTKYLDMTTHALYPAK
ncbi:MAG: hypothetical protein ACI4OA_06200 [Selenomonadaceae bacterium]